MFIIYLYIIYITCDTLNALNASLDMIYTYTVYVL